jgi:hypothetical protein
MAALNPRNLKKAKEKAAWVTLSKLGNQYEGIHKNIQHTIKKRMKSMSPTSKKKHANEIFDEIHNHRHKYANVNARINEKLRKRGILKSPHKSPKNSYNNHVQQLHREFGRSYRNAANALIAHGQEREQKWIEEYKKERNAQHKAEQYGKNLLKKMSNDRIFGIKPAPTRRKVVPMAEQIRIAQEKDALAAEARAKARADRAALKAKAANAP